MEVEQGAATEIFDRIFLRVSKAMIDDMAVARGTRTKALRSSCVVLVEHTLVATWADVSRTSALSELIFQRRAVNP
jgi:hypothetical protein